MTQDMMTLRGFWRRAPMPTLPSREMIGSMAERLMALEVEGLTAPLDGERSADPPTATATATGPGRPGPALDAEDPEAQEGDYFPGVLEPRLIKRRRWLR